MPGLPIAKGVSAGPGVSASGAGGAFGAMMTVIVPALLGASMAGAVEPNCGVAATGAGGGAGGNATSLRFRWMTSNWYSRQTRNLPGKFWS
jgi:hypothetical protein